MRWVWRLISIFSASHISYYTAALITTAHGENVTRDKVNRPGSAVVQEAESGKEQMYTATKPFA